VAKKKISLALTGIHRSEKTKKIMSKAHKGKSSGMLGKHHTEETKKKLSKNNTRYWFGKKRPPLSKEQRRKMSEVKRGEKSSFWKGGISLKNRRIRAGIEFRLWREAVFARDNWTCQKYQIKGYKLVPHHIQNFSQFPELRFAIDNGITLSDKAHQEFHKKYGKKDNTREQLEEFLAVNRDPY